MCKELIILMRRQVRRKIVSELKQEKYYSIIVDSTSDVSHVDQVAFLVCYVSCYHKSAALDLTVISTLEECTMYLGECCGQ
ncbi:unnamed protein product [Diabrotica balteata]|uniref:DUF4371 domain-containing protein n=1 Tax=Diabrotica balteata TaxID=107213 RepID=A0A9N9T3D2_DIABA|nr:unnamed protein product [Diabrotica balteata]